VKIISNKIEKYFTIQIIVVTDKIGGLS